MAADKNQSIIDYLSQCDAVKSNPLFFNFISAKEDNKQIITNSNEKILDKTFVDGSVLKRYTVTFIDFKSVVYQAIPKVPGYPNENVQELFDVQGILDWVNENNRNRVFPDFGSDCDIQSIEALTDNPTLNGVDSNVSPPLAKYSFAIKVEYIDTTDVLWGKE